MRPDIKITTNFQALLITLASQKSNTAEHISNKILKDMTALSIQHCIKRRDQGWQK